MSETIETPQAAMPVGLVKKLCQVMAATGWVEKSGTNQKHGYAYATEADVLSMLREELAQRKVFIFPSIVDVKRQVHSKTSGGYDMFITDIMVKWTFLDGDTGETQECLMPGCGTDTGDKGLYKAITGSSKYLFLKAFMLPTGDDPEQEKPDHAEGVAAAKKVAVSKLKQAAKGDETITLMSWKEGRIALNGTGLAIMRASMTEEEKKRLGIVYDSREKVWHMPAALGFSFVDACERVKVPTVWMDAPTEKRSLPKAEIPPMPEVDDQLSNGHDPIITSAKRVKGNKPGAKEFLSVEWGGKKASCWSKSLWPHLEHYVGRPAVLTLVANGKYLNVEGIVSLDGEEFYEEPIDLGDA